MNDTLRELLVIGPAGFVAVVVLAVAAARGALSLKHAPVRAVDLAPFDLLIAFGLFILSAAGAGLVVGMLGIDADSYELTTALATLGAQVVMHGPPALYILIRLAVQPRGLVEWGLLPRRPGRELLAAGAGFMLAMPLVLAVNVTMVFVGLLIGFDAPDVGHELLRLMRDADSPTVVAVMALSAVVVAPVAEEIIFRGLIQTVLLNALGREHRWFALIIASMVFAAVHIPATPWQTWGGLFILGMMFGWLYERYGSLLPACLMHGLFNATNIALLFVIEPGAAQ